MIARIQHAHALYCRLTGQCVSLRFDRQRLWYDFFCAGFTEADLQRVVGYLQREIRERRRNVGALKLYNLLQPDRFEDDLNISRVRLTASSPRPQNPVALRPPTCSPAEQQRGRQRALEHLRQLKEHLR